MAEVGCVIVAYRNDLRIDLYIGPSELAYPRTALTAAAARSSNGATSGC